MNRQLTVQERAEVMKEYLQKCVRSVGSAQSLVVGVLLGCLALSGAGCLQIETNVRLNEDGSARIRERVFFSERLLDLAGEKRGEVAALLGKERLLERMKQMGKGLTLVRHKTREGGDGWMESVAEFDVVDLNNFRYVSPWLASGDYAANSAVRFQLKPQYKSAPYGNGPAGVMSVDLVLDKGGPHKGGAPKVLTPQEQQVYRDIAPAIRDMLKGFRLRLTFKSYAPTGGRIGNVLLDVSDTDMDGVSQLFFENEEIMLELLRLDFGGPNTAGNVWKNEIEPKFLPLGSRNMWWGGGGRIWFRPSKALFAKYFEGKKLDYSVWRAAPPDKHVPALFEKIGWHPPKKDAGVPEKKAAPGNE